MNALQMVLAGPVPMSRQTKLAARKVLGPRADEDMITECPASAARVVAALSELKQSQHGAFAVSIAQLTDMVKIGHTSIGESLAWLLHAGVVTALDVSGRAINPEDRKGRHVRWMLRDFLSELLKPLHLRSDVRAVLRAACAIRIAEQGTGRRTAGDDREDAGISFEGCGVEGGGGIDAEISDLASRMMRVGKRMQQEQGVSVRKQGLVIERAGFELMQWQHTYGKGIE